MFLVMCNEAFGYDHERTLDSSFVTLIGMLEEHGYLMRKRNAAFRNEDGGGENGEYVEMVDFDTGKVKMIRKVETL